MLFLIALTSSRPELCGRDPTQKLKKMLKIRKFPNHPLSKNSYFLNIWFRKTIPTPIDRQLNGLSNATIGVAIQSMRRDPAPFENSNSEKTRNFEKKNAKKAYASPGLKGVG